MAVSSGTRLGPYEIQSPLGAGGMGEVYRARDTRLDRTVAVKVLPSHLSENPEAKQRFDREARAISSLNHPNICTLFDVGHQDGMDYLVMEYLEGETLADRLAKGALPTEQVLKIGIEICEGLERAHRTGVVHRDLKPGNIMLTKSGAKLMDFGLAKAAAPAVAPVTGLTMTVSTPAAGQPLTAQGSIMGTFHYMSPEQAKEKKRMRAAIFFRWARCCMKWRPGASHSRGRHSERDRGFAGARSAADLGCAADVAAIARPRGEDLSGEGSRPAISECARCNASIEMDR